MKRLSNSEAQGWIDQACAAASGTRNIKGRKDPIKYQQILEANITLSVKKLKMKRGWLMQQDNDPKHTSKSTIDCIKRCKFCYGPYNTPS